MNITTDIYLILEALNKSVKVFSQDITEACDKHIAETRPVYYVGEFKQVCYDVANEFRVKWEDANDLGGRPYARTRIRLD